MMYPILCKVRYEALHLSFKEKALWIHVAFSIVVNWIIAPLFMVISLYFSVPISALLTVPVAWLSMGFLPD